MQVEIFEIMPGPEGWQLDLERRVALINVQEGTFAFDDPTRERLVRGIFENDFSAFIPVAPSEGLHADGVTRLKAWAPETVRYILDEELYGHSLGGRIVP